MALDINSIEDLESIPEAQAKKPAPLPEAYKPEQAPQIRAAIDVAKQSRLTADTVNRATAIGKSLGLPMPVVANALEYAQDQELAQRIENNDLLSTWIGKDQYKAAIAVGDLDKVTSLFEALQKESEHRKAQHDELGFFKRTGLLLEEGIQDVANGMEASITGAVRFFSKAEFQDAEGNVQTAESSALRNWADAMDRRRDATLAAQAPRLEAQTALGGYLQDVVRMAPQIASQVAATLTTGPMGGMAVMGSQIAGGQYDRLRRDGVDTDRAFKAGVANALMQAPLEQIGAGKLLDIFKATGLGNIAKGSLQGAATEGFTEFLQAYPESATDIWARLGQNEGAKEWFERFKSALPETTKQGLYEGLVAAPFGILGGVGRAMHENALAAYARNFQQRQVDLHDTVDQLREAGTQTDIIESILDHGGQNVEVGISAQGLVDLYQGGRDLITPLGLNLEDVAAAAQAGQDIMMSLSATHAPLNKEDYAALAPHIRPQINGPTAAEAAQGPVNVADVERVVELYQDNKKLFDELDEEKARLKEELRKEMANSPNLQVQVEGFGGFDKFADDWLAMLERYALRMGTSQDPVETLRRVTLDDLRLARMNGQETQGGPTVSPEAASSRRLIPEEAPETARPENTAPETPASTGTDIFQWLAEQEELDNPFSEKESLAERPANAKDDLSRWLEAQEELENPFSEKESLAERPANAKDDLSRWLEAQEELENPFAENANPEANLEEGQAQANETASDDTSQQGEWGPIAWSEMLDENYLSQNAIMDMDMTRFARDTWFLSKNKNELPVLNSGMSYADFREGLARWRKKYPNSEGFREIEEHLDWIESVADANGEELYQDGSETRPEPWREKLQQDVEAWEKTVDDFMSGSLNKRQQVKILSQTPLVFSLVGAKPDLPVSTTYHALRKILVDKHKLPESVLKEVPRALADPIMVFESATVKNDYVAMLDLKDESGATVVVPISLDYDGIGGYKINYVPSIYAKTGIDNTHGNAWFKTQIENGNLRYINNKKSREWAKSSGLYLPRVGSHPVNGKQKIFTEADLVKLREQYNNEYYHSPDTPRGSVQIHPESYLISLFEKADLSTLLHETGHIFFEEMERLVKAGAADASVIADYNTMRDWLGVKDGEALNTEQREQAARGFEAYLMEGKAPSPELGSAFRRFKKWLLRIYQSAIGLRVELNDEVRLVFSRMISTEQEIIRAAYENELLELTAKEIDALGLTDGEAALVNWA